MNHHETMTVYEALSAIKMLDKRIVESIAEFTPCTTNKHSNNKIGKFTVDEYKDYIRSSMQSITDMLARREAIKRAVITSNASTKITVCGEEYTVAEAIERKQHGNHYYMLLNERFVESYNESVRKAERENGDKLTVGADSYVASLYGAKEKNVSSDTVNDARKFYIDTNTVDIIDPLGSVEFIKKLSASIDNFAHELDSKLSVSNATTKIEVEY